MAIEIGNREILCDRDAFSHHINTADWMPSATAIGEEALRADMYYDPDAGPGQVRAVVAEIRTVKGAWQMRLHATMVDGDGQVRSGTIGKHYKELTSDSSAKMQATRNVHKFMRGTTAMPFAPDPVDGAWRPGDWVIDAAGAVWVRASDADAAAGRAWGKPPAAAWCERGDRRTVSIPAGGVRDDAAARPLVLLIRDGYPTQPQLGN